MTEKNISHIVVIGQHLENFRVFYKKILLFLQSTIKLMILNKINLIKSLKKIKINQFLEISPKNKSF
jgi:hypothetical protein